MLPPEEAVDPHIEPGKQGLATSPQALFTLSFSAMHEVPHYWWWRRFSQNILSSHDDEETSLAALLAQEKFSHQKKQ